MLLFLRHDKTSSLYTEACKNKIEFSFEKNKRRLSGSIPAEIQKTRHHFYPDKKAMPRQDLAKTAGGVAGHSGSRKEIRISQ